MKKKKEKVMDKKEDLKEEEIIQDNEEESEVKKDDKDILIDKLENEVVSLSKEIEKVKKAAADITNRKKQMEIDRKYAASGLVKKLLVPMSYFEGALKFESDDEAFNNFLKGFEMVYNLLLDTLKSEGLKEIETNVDDPFDPRYHEVTEIVEVEENEDRVVDVVHKGYMFKDRVISPAKVKVSKLKKEDQNNQENQDNENQKED